MNVKQFARLGGKARWKGISKKKRSEIMSKVSHARRANLDKKRKKLSIAGTVDNKLAR